MPQCVAIFHVPRQTQSIANSPVSFSAGAEQELGFNCFMLIGHVVLPPPALLACPSPIRLFRKKSSFGNRFTTEILLQLRDRNFDTGLDSRVLPKRLAAHVSRPEEEPPEQLFKMAII